MKLPIRIGDVEDVELREVSGADIAEVQRIAKNGDIYTAFLTFATCCTASLGDLTDKTQIREAYKKATFDSVYMVVMYGLALVHGTDKVEGRYKCKCGNVVEHLGDFADPLPECTPIDDEPVTMDIDRTEITNKKTGEVLFSAENVTMRRATMEDCIRAYRRYPDDESNMQFEIYKECLISVDGKEISEKDRQAFGSLLFQKMKIKALNEISSKLTYHSTVECVCMKCKTRWQAEVDYSGFFDLGVV